MAAYFYLPRNSGDVSVRTERHEPGLVIDFAEDGRAIGVEITAPRAFSLEILNRALASVSETPATADDVAPLLSSAASADSPV